MTDNYYNYHTNYDTYLININGNIYRMTTNGVFGNMRVLISSIGILSKEVNKSRCTWMYMDTRH